ncbi:MAG: siderophore-interacting protein [Beutenbergiaceae bacterium]
MVSAAPAKPARPQLVLEVLRTEQLSPHLVRVIVGGADFNRFQNNDFTDTYVKILFANPEFGLEPPYDLAQLREQRPQALPAVRTYTVRWVNEDAQELALDFVIHGDEGIAGPWATQAQPGDQVVFSGPGGGYRPDLDADWYLFVGDLSALPAIAAALESLPARARGRAVLAADPADELELTRPDGIELVWVRGGSNPLLQELRMGQWLPGRVQAFVHGERGVIKQLRRYLTDEREIGREQLSISAYWARGRVEDQFQAEKREQIGQI